MIVRLSLFPGKVQAWRPKFPNRLRALGHLSQSPALRQNWSPQLPVPDAACTWWVTRLLERHTGAQAMRQKFPHRLCAPGGSLNHARLWRGGVRAPHIQLSRERNPCQAVARVDVNTSYPTVWRDQISLDQNEDEI